MKEEDTHGSAIEIQCAVKLNISLRKNNASIIADNENILYSAH